MAHDEAEYRPNIQGYECGLINNEETCWEFPKYSCICEFYVSGVLCRGPLPAGEIPAEHSWVMPCPRQDRPGCWSEGETDQDEEGEMSLSEHVEELMENWCLDE